MKKINLLETFKDVHGKTIIQKENDVNEDGEHIVNRFDLTLGYMFKVALLRSEGLLEESEVLRRVVLIDRIIESNDSIELKKDDLDYIKGLIIKAYDVYLAGKALQVINK
jgi:hypothetical protein